MIAKLILTTLFFVCSITSRGQEIKIKSVALQPNDQTAMKFPCLDNNKDTCALLKIKTNNLDGIEFTNHNQYIKATYSDGTYFVYVPELSKKLDFQHKDYMPIQLNMADYGYKKLRKGKTYVIILDAPQKTDLKSSVVLNIEPKNARVIFDEKELEIDSNGTYDIQTSAGNHMLMVTLDNYFVQNRTISVSKSQVRTISIRLQPITHDVLVGCNVNNAHVFVDNIDYGRIGTISIPQGEHIIRVQAEGYVDSENKVIINSATRPLSFFLKENKRITHIHATPVTIYSNSSSIYKDNKKIKEWSNGAIIKFMPGKYLLSDDKGKTQKIVVSDKPLVIRM